MYITLQNRLIIPSKKLFFVCKNQQKADYYSPDSHDTVAWRARKHSSMMRTTRLLTVGASATRCQCRGVGCSMRSKALWAMVTRGPPCGQTDTHEWKHYLLPTSLAGSNNSLSIAWNSMVVLLEKVGVGVQWVSGEKGIGHGWIVSSKNTAWRWPYFISCHCKMDTVESTGESESNGAGQGKFGWGRVIPDWDVECLFCNIGQNLHSKTSNLIPPHSLENGQKEV